MEQLVLDITDDDFISIQQVTDAYNAVQSTLPEGWVPVTALDFLRQQIQMRILDRWTQLRTDAETAALIAKVLASPDLRAQALAAPSEVLVSAKMVK